MIAIAVKTTSELIHKLPRSNDARLLGRTFVS